MKTKLLTIFGMLAILLGMFPGSVLAAPAPNAAPVATRETVNDGVPIGVLSAGDYHTCALTPSGAVSCWGYNDFGEAEDQPGPYTQVAADRGHSCALTPSGSVDCWGLNDLGQSEDQPGPYTQVSSGSYHNCGLKPDGSVDCWGYNNRGQSEDQPGPYTQISVGGFHSCALTPDGAVDCWGWNPFGESENRPGPYTQVSAGYYNTCALTPSGAVDCWGGNNYGESVAQPGPYTQVSAGLYHTCALTTSGAVDCWGFNSDGEAEDQVGPYILVSAGYYHNCALMPSGAIDCWGLNTLGQAEDQPGPDSPSNTAPIANPGGPYLGAINTAISFDGSLSSDPENDNLTYAWTFGDGATATGSAPAKAYTTTGVYDVCLTVNDGALDSASACTLAVVYDPSVGFVTGGGWIDSPAGAYKADQSLAGRANFGFVSKYLKGATVPTGTTAFSFDVAGLSFSSTSYNWLVVNRAGTYAQFKGAGLVNGAPDGNGNAYKFMVWAGNASPDTFRIRIWWEDAAGEHDVYDNGVDQAIGAGNIVVHLSK